MWLLRASWVAPGIRSSQGVTSPGPNVPFRPPWWGTWKTRIEAGNLAAIVPQFSASASPGGARLDLCSPQGSVRSAMARMRWWRLEWERKARTHEPLADPHLSVSTERERQKQQRRGKKAERQRNRRLKQRQRMSASRTETQGGFHAPPPKAVARVSRERETRAPAVIARELGIGEATAARYLAGVGRGGEVGPVPPWG